MISKYLLLIGLISLNIVNSNNMYFGRPYIPYFYSIPRNNVFQTLQDNVGSFNRKPDVQWNAQYQGSILSQLPQVVNRNNEEYKIQHRSYVDRQFEPQGSLMNHHLWNIQAQQALLRRHQSEKQKQYREYLLKKQEQEKLKKENMLKKQRSKFLQRLYYENLLHREYDEKELEMHRKNADET